MLSNEVIENLRYLAGKDLTDAQFERDVEGLQAYLFLNTTDVRFERIITEVANAVPFRYPILIRDYTNPEIFMKILGEMVFKDEISSATNRDEMVGLAKLLRDPYFGVIRSTVDLSKLDKDPPVDYHGKPINNLSVTEKHFLRVYKFRGDLAHDINQDLTFQNLPSVIASMTYCMLYLCGKYHDKLREKYLQKRKNEGLDLRSYAKQIIADHDALVSGGFGYLDIRWVPVEGGEALPVSEILKQNEKQIQLLGDAGMGKTTAMREIAYLLSKDIVDYGKRRIPVYVELERIHSGKDIIRDAICETLAVDGEVCDVLLERGDLCLLLDGYNEILNLELRREFSSQLDLFVLRNGKTQVILSDRALKKNLIPVMNQAKKKTVLPLTLEEKVKYFELNCSPDAKVLELVREKASADPLYFATVNNPLQLKHLLEVAERTGALPNDLTQGYLEMLMERESLEKKDPNMQYLPYILQGIAASMDQPEAVTLAAAQVLARKICSCFGYTAADVSQCLTLAVEMGILTYEDQDHIAFSTENFHTYFWTAASYNGVAQELAKAYPGDFS